METNPDICGLIQNVIQRGFYKPSQGIGEFFIFVAGLVIILLANFGINNNIRARSSADIIFSHDQSGIFNIFQIYGSYSFFWLRVN
jgi:hypothetical protein